MAQVGAAAAAGAGAATQINADLVSHDTHQAGWARRPVLRIPRTAGIALGSRSPVSFGKEGSSMKDAVAQLLSAAAHHSLVSDQSLSSRP